MPPGVISGKGKGEAGTKLLSLVTHLTDPSSCYRRRTAENVSKYVSRTHRRVPTLLYNTNTVVHGEFDGATERSTKLVDLSVDNEAALAWLDTALSDAISRGQMALIAYLEAVLEDLVFEMELDAPSGPLFRVS